MAAAERAYDFQVSDYFFRLTSEGVRLFSNSVQRHCSLNEVVERRSERAPELADSYEAEDLHEHLRLIPAEGDVKLSITMLESSAETIDAAIPLLEQALGKSVRFVEAVSMLLFDLIVERNATEVLTKLGLSAHEADKYRMSLKRRVINVVPFR